MSRPVRTEGVSIAGAIKLGAKPKFMTVKGAFNRQRFLAFIQRVLKPWLKRGAIVVMDNLPFHKSPEVVDAIRSTGAEVLYLPPYSPDFNPIELWWADLKRVLRRIAADALAPLLEAIELARSQVRPKKIAAWFRCAMKAMRTPQAHRN
jgi:transposase